MVQNGDGFSGMCSARVVKSWKNSPRFQRKVQETRLCVNAPQRVMHEAVRVNLKLQRRSQEVRDARKVEDLPRQTGHSEQSQPKKSSYVDCRQQVHRKKTS